jgi:hypothetical protein
MKTAYRVFLAACISCCFTSSVFAQSAPAELKLEVLTANSTVVTIKAIMTIVPVIMNVEAVSVAVRYDPNKFNINPTTTVSNRYFQASGWENASVVPWDSTIAVVVYGEYHPSFGSNPLLRNNPPVLCHFNFYPKNSPGTADFIVYANNPTGALTYYFEGGFAQQQNFSPVINLFGVFYPVELSSFTAVQQGEAVVLQWVTASETNNFGFFVERSEVDSGIEKSWEELNFVKGAGDTRSESQYLFIDQALPRDGRYAYRLRQQDFDGTITHTRPVVVEYRARPHVFSLGQNFPNPVSLSTGGSTMMQYDIAETGPVRLHISNILGQTVTTLVDDVREPGRYSASWHPAGLPAGTYIATLSAHSPESGKSDVRHMTMQIVR